MKILIVDDHEDGRIILRKNLEASGCEVKVAANGKEALDMAWSSPPDVIIADILMPVMDGFRLCREVRCHREFRRTRFVFYTATYKDASDRELAMKLGADAFLIKPMEPEEFIGVLKEIMERKAAEVAPEPECEEAILQLYNERLVAKLEKKVVDLEREIEVRRKLEEALRAIEERYRIYYANSSDVFYSFDTNLTLLSVSPSVGRLLGYRPEEIVGRPFPELGILAPQSIGAALEDTRRVLGGEVVEGAVYEFIAKGGSRRYGEVSAAPLFEDGKVSGVIAVARDITRRMEAEQALLRSERRLSYMNRIAQVFLTIPDEQVYAEVLDIILEALESSCGVFGFIDENNTLVCPSMTGDVWDQCRVAGKTIEFPSKTWSGIWGRALRERRSLFANGPFQVPRGHIPVTRALCVPMVHQEKLLGLITVANKETDYDEKDKKLLESFAEYVSPVLHARLERDAHERERKKLEDQLSHAQKMEAIGTLAGGVAHDFNNILTAILGNADLAMLERDEADPLYFNLNEIRKAGRRAVGLTRQLLAFSRKELVRPKVVNLNDVVKNMEKMLRRLIGEDVDLAVTCDSYLWPVLADPGQMEQVIMNLAVNSRDAMPTGGKLSIETANVELDSAYFRDHGLEDQSGRYVMLAVTDTGLGMDEKTKERVFDPFFTTKERGRGTGLGLSTVYGIVRQNKGKIWVYSEEGTGTTIKIYLPATDKNAESVEKERTVVASPSGSETILVVEDDDALREITRQCLEGCGFRVLTAGNGREAVEIAVSHAGSIELLLTDVVMPGMNGRELAARLQGEFPQMKVVYMSGYTDNVIAHHGVLEKDIDFIEKPFGREALANKIRDVLDRSG